MMKHQFAKVFDLTQGQVLVLKAVAEDEKLPAIKVSTFSPDGNEVKVLYAFGTQIIRDASFEYFTQKHAENFLANALDFLSAGGASAKSPKAS